MCFMKKTLKNTSDRQEVLLYKSESTLQNMILYVAAYFASSFIPVPFNVQMLMHDPMSAYST